MLKSDALRIWICSSLLIYWRDAFTLEDELLSNFFGCDRGLSVREERERENQLKSLCGRLIRFGKVPVAT